MNEMRKNRFNERQRRITSSHLDQTHKNRRLYFSVVESIRAVLS